MILLKVVVALGFVIRVIERPDPLPRVLFRISPCESFETFCIIISKVAMPAALRGKRFHVDLPSDDEGGAHESHHSQQPSFSPAFVKDIQEKQARPPQAPTGNSSTRGFPVHKKRTGISRFKQARSGANGTASSTDATLSQPPASLQHNSDETFAQRERREIDEENNRRLASMSDAEIEQERNDLMQGLSPALLQRLLRRANMEEDKQPQDFPGIATAETETTHAPTQVDSPASKPPIKHVTFAEAEADGEMPEVADSRDDEIDSPLDNEPSEPAPPPSILTDPLSSGVPPSIHFPKPPSQQDPDLDPDSTTFLTDLHTKYFPNTPFDPSTLAWMSDPNPTDITYSPSASELPITAMRFSFRGELIPPALSNQIPTTKGLHHHGDSPGSAGYTISELAHLARSSFPSQRCMAFQTLGRVLYRLGKGEFAGGEEGEVMDRGLWACMRQGRVLDTLKEEVAKKGGHVSAKAYATDALWLWRMGGGKEPIEVGAN